MVPAKPPSPPPFRPPLPPLLLVHPCGPRAVAPPGEGGQLPLQLPSPPITLHPPHHPPPPPSSPITPPPISPRVSGPRATQGHGHTLHTPQTPEGGGGGTSCACLKED